MENKENKTSQTVLRILVILGILAILVFLSIGIVRLVPRALTALSNATSSLSHLFRSGSTSSSTNSTSTSPTGGSGFIVISTSTPSQTGTKGSTSSNTGGKTSSGTTYRPSTSYSSGNVAGNPDLAVTIYSKGIIDSRTGQYVETNNFTTSDTIVVKFKVENQGTGSTGSWALTVNMPSVNTSEQVKNIPNIASIAPGRAIEGQAIFSNPTTATPVVTITADPSNVVRESNENNNTAVMPLYVTGNPWTSPVGSAAPDLAIRNLQTGLIGTNGDFIPTTTFRRGDTVAIRYEVTNYGQTATGPWYFQAVANTNPVTTYNSGAEQTLAGGSTVVYTLGFQNIQYGANNITVALDPNAYMVEGNESNNIASVNFNVSY